MGGLFAASGWGRRPLRWVQAALIGGWMTMGAAYGAEPLEAWPSVPPESAGLSEARLKAAWENLAARRTKAFLVVRGGRIVFERYAEDFGPNRKHYTASLAKALVGGLSLAIASADGRIAPDDRAARYIPAWQDDPIRSRITIRHLATHTSGIEDAEEDGLPHERLPGWKGAFWRQDQNPFLLARDEASVLFEPGTDYAYSNPGMAMLAYAVTAALEGTEHPDLRTLLRERLFRPLGIPDSAWSIGYERTFETEGLPLVPNWGGGGFTARATARIGQLLLQEGRWAGRELIAPQWVRRAITDAGMPRPPRSEAQPAPASGMGFYTNNDRVWENVPSDAFAGAGAGHQVMIVVPSLELVIVRYGGTLDRNGESLEFWGQIKAQVLDPVMAAFLDPAVVQEASVRGGATGRARPGDPLGPAGDDPPLG
ncbi:MAG: hypothetical protein KatS3mg115_2483 [Candidatus Poribacteria bacterium]|nr:MAG: hypothetical protein KatS3mg115_2483 [Candidatus Poribacteria bacterium]